jgi:hypothetical protein
MGIMNIRDGRILMKIDIGDGDANIDITVKVFTDMGQLENSISKECT